MPKGSLAFLLKFLTDLTIDDISRRKNQELTSGQQIIPPEAWESHGVAALFGWGHP